MKTNAVKPDRHFLLIGLLMFLLGMGFLFYIETTLFNASKKYLRDNYSSEVNIVSTDKIDALSLER